MDYTAYHTNYSLHYFSTTPLNHQLIWGIREIGTKKV